MTAVRQLTEPCTFHGEGPFWDGRIGRLRLVDMLAGAIVTVDEAGSTTRRQVGDVAALIRHRRDSGYVVATERGFALCDDELTVQQSIEAFSTPALRMNEGGCDPQGRLLCGSMAYDGESAAGTLYRLTTDHRVEIALAGVSVPNGLPWSADGASVFHADTGLNRVTRYDCDAESGELRDPRTWIAFDGSAGSPDGMAMDADGGLWIAMWGGGAVRHFGADGTLREVLELPVTNVTSCVFGGPGNTTLYVTTSRQGIPDGAEPEAGAVFTAESGVRGAVVHDFAA